MAIIDSLKLSRRECLSSRFKYNGSSAIETNDVQERAISTISNRLQQGVWSQQEIACPTCDSENSRNIAQQDRYGIPHEVVICRNCGLIYQNPRPTEDAHAEFWNDFFRQLYGGGGTAFTESRFEAEKREVGPILDFIDDYTDIFLKEAKVLDIGCGPGGMVAELEGQVERVEGYDLDAESVQYAQREHNLPVEQGSIGDIRLDWEPDIVLLTHVIGHLHNPVDQLAKVYDICTDETIIYVRAPGVKNLRRSYKGDFRRLLQFAKNFYFTLTTLNELMKKAHFEIIAGTEEIRAIYKPSSATSDHRLRSDYKSVLQYLKVMEYYRFVKFLNPHFYITHESFKKFLRYVGLFAGAKRIYDAVFR